MNRYSNRANADRAVEWLVEHFSVAVVGKPELRDAMRSAWPDFEEAVVAAAAQSNACHVIVTRNVRDFRNSPMPPMTPDEYLLTGSGSVQEP